MKSGTTTLHFLLEDHPQVFFPKKYQEIHFFDDNYFYRKGVSWFERQFSGCEGEQVVAQTSPCYLFEPYVPKRILSITPDAKFIFILRNPVDRAYSHYWHNIRYGAEKLSFEDALKQEDCRIQRDSISRVMYSYKSRGLYAHQLNNYYRHFPEESIKIFMFDQLLNNISATYDVCSDFLSIDRSGFSCSKEKTKNYNPTLLPRSRKIQEVGWWLRKKLPLYGPMKRLAIPSLVVDYLNLKHEKYPPMSNITCASLREFFAEDIEKLEKLLDQDLKHWCSPL